jgi:hypothetical protein
MKKVRIWFDDMDGEFNVDENFITNILKKKYQVILDKNTPDYLFYSNNSKRFLQYDCIRIYYSVENLVPDFNLCDYAIGFHYLNFEDRYIRYPLYLVNGFKAYNGDNYSKDLELAQQKHENFKYNMGEKKEFCAFTYSNGNAAECREKIFKALMEYKHVDSGGRYLNNIGGAIDDKLEFQKRHRFVVAFENTSTPGYTTEKIVSAFAACAVPIYWGNPNIEKEFNKESFINCHDYGLTKEGKKEVIDRIIDEVKRIDLDDGIYEKMLAAPAFTDVNNVERQKYELEKFIFNIFDQSKENAYRRNRYYWGMRYERKIRIGNNWYYLLRKALPLWNIAKNIKGETQR